MLAESTRASGRCKVSKDHEYREFQEIITLWEREILMFNV